MSKWTPEELSKIGAVEEIQLSSLKDDGTLRKPVTIWVVNVGDDLYVRAVNGQSGAWYRGTQVRHEGHIRAGRIDKDVAFLDETDLAINRQIDDAYRTKYHRYSANIVNSVLTSKARASTIKLVPR
jgi:hypothetical protein